MPGRYGYALAAATAALDRYKPGAQSSESRAAAYKDGEKAGNYQTGPSYLEQTVDMGLAVTKAVGLKAS